MIDEKRSIDPKWSFLAGWFVGRRRRSGVSTLLLIAGAFAALLSLGSMVSAPLSWFQARAIKNLPQPDAAGLQSLAPGTEAIIALQLGPDEGDADHGLGLFYVERSNQSERTPDPEAAGPPPPDWVLQTAPAATVDALLLDGTAVKLQLSPDTSFSNAQTITAAADESLRYVGYLPGQALAVHGSWQGDNRIVAEKLHAGTPQAYVERVASVPGFTLIVGFVCGALAIVLLFAGGAMRFAGV